MNFFNFLTGIKNISVWDTIFSIWLSPLSLGKGLGQFKFSVSTTMELPSPWSPQLWIFLHHSLHCNRFTFTMVSIWLPLSSYRHPINRINSSSLRKNDWRSSFGKYQVLICLPRINFLYDSILFSTIGINPSLN